MTITNLVELTRRRGWSVQLKQKEAARAMRGKRIKTSTIPPGMVL